MEEHSDGEVYKICDKESEKKIHLFTSIRNTMTDI